MPNHDSSEASLFIRLGGREGIGRLVSGLYERLHGDPRINGFWKGHSDDSNARELQSVIDFVAQGAGGPVVYEGRDMRTSHEGLVITRRDWTTFFEHSKAVLTSFDVPEKEKREVLMWFESFKELVALLYPAVGLLVTWSLRGSFVVLGAAVLVCACASNVEEAHLLD